jgi:hypothetical protein
MKKYDLVGINGNAFNIIAYVKESMKKEKKSKEEIDKYISEAQSGDYDNLVFVSVNMIDELNEKY